MLLSETFRMICLKCVSCNGKLVKIALTFNIAYKIHFFLGKNYGGTRHPYEKNEPTLDHSGGCTVRTAGS